MSLWTELRRRNVMRVGVGYAVVAFFLIEVSLTTFPVLRLPEWVASLITVLLIIGFPVALVLAWFFELTPDGIVRDGGDESAGSPAEVSDRLFYFVVIGFLATGVAFFVLDKFVWTGADSYIPVIAQPAVEQSASTDISSTVPGFAGRSAIAVMPFINMSNDEEQEYFADGITEDLITGLQSFRTFPVIARTSTFTYKGTSPDVREIAKNLGAGYIVEGSVRKVGENVRINVQLNNRDGQHLWAKIYDFKYEDVLRTQSELVTRIMTAIEPEILISEADRKRFVRTEDMQAFDYFLRAASNSVAPFAFTDLNGRSVSLERQLQAREYALKAVELDPDFAAGWRMLNHIEGVMTVNYAHLLTAEEIKQAVKRGIEYGERSRQLSAFEPSVCSCLAALLLIDGDLEGALILQEESLKLNPSSAMVHAILAKALQLTGDSERALSEIHIAKRLSPEDMAMSTFLAFESTIYIELSRFGEAESAAKRALVFAPRNYDAEYLKIVAQLSAGRRDAAKKSVAKHLMGKPPGFQPTSGWHSAFFGSAAAAITLESGEMLQGMTFDDGIQRIFTDLSADRLR